MRVVDLGAAPGGWAQVAVKRGAARVVGVDLLPVNRCAAPTIIQGDFNDPALPGRLRELLGGPADLVLSDMAPNTTGPCRDRPYPHHRRSPSWRCISPWRCWREGGGFVAKVFQGGAGSRC